MKLRILVFKNMKIFLILDDLEKINLNNFFSSKEKNWLNWKYNIYIKKKISYPKSI